MAKVTLRAGAELDILNADEARAIIVDLLERKRHEPTEEPIRASESGLTDGTGFVKIVVYACPMGREFVLTRLIVDADGYSPGLPFKNGVGWIDVNRSEERVDFVNLQNGLPSLSIDSKESGNRWRNGETVEVAMTGGPATTTVRVKIHGLLRTFVGDGEPGRRRSSGRVV